MRLTDNQKLALVQIKNQGWTRLTRSQTALLKKGLVALDKTKPSVRAYRTFYPVVLTPAGNAEVECVLRQDIDNWRLLNGSF